MIGLPPFGGAVQLTVAEASAAVAVTFCGALGTVMAGEGVIGPEGAEGAPVPRH